MTAEDVNYIQKLIGFGVLSSPVLELGVGYGGSICRDIVQNAGLKYYGTDMVDGPHVDFVANFEKKEELAKFASVGTFGTILILNVLEHTFDPIRILDNALSLVKENGVFILLTPVIWPLHSYPMDVWRILPNFYEEYQ